MRTLYIFIFFFVFLFFFLFFLVFITITRKKRPFFPKTGNKTRKKIKNMEKK